jgi:pimeloyl-ACP methyl ester carboxylesterase
MTVPWQSWIAGLLKLLAWGVGIYAGLCLAAFLVQRRLMYFPDRSTEQDALQRAARMGLSPWRDGTGSLLGWRRPTVRPGAMRILVLHGNAGDAIGRVDYMPMLEAAGFEGVLLEYPGYGPRGGIRSETSMVADARGALRRLKEESTSPMILLGESLGSGVAVQVAAAEPGSIAGLLLPVPFARMTEVAAHHYPFLPMSLILRDRWDSLGAVRSYTGPVAILVAGGDEVVGASQGHRLAQACPGPVQVWEVPGAAHNELSRLPGRPPWSEALAFLRDRAEMGQ